MSFEEIEAILTTLTYIKEARKELQELNNNENKKGGE